MQLINDILSDLQKLLNYFNGSPIVTCFRTPFAPSELVFSNNLGLYLTDLKPSPVFAISALKRVPSSFE